MRQFPSCPGTCSVDQAGLELRDPPASASWVLGLKTCATTIWLMLGILIQGLKTKRRRLRGLTKGEVKEEPFLTANQILIPNSHSLREGSWTSHKSEGFFLELLSTGQTLSMTHSQCLPNSVYKALLMPVCVVFSILCDFGILFYLFDFCFLRQSFSV